MMWTLQAIDQVQRSVARAGPSAQIEIPKSTRGTRLQQGTHFEVAAIREQDDRLAQAFFDVQKGPPAAEVDASR